MYHNDVKSADIGYAEKIDVDVRKSLFFFITNVIIIVLQIIFLFNLGEESNKWKTLTEVTH